MGAPRATGSEMTRTVGTRIRIARIDLGMSQAGLAQRMTEAGCTVRTSGVWKIEHGYRNGLTVDEAVAFARVLRMPIERLLGPGPACMVCDDVPGVDVVCFNCGLGGCV